MLSASPHYSRECLLTAITGRTTPEQAALHAAQDDVGEWATEHAANLRAGVADARVYDLAERERKQRLLESVTHLRGCRGLSCQQGRQPCRDRCHAEMGNLDREAWKPKHRPEPPKRAAWPRFKRWVRRTGVAVLAFVLGPHAF
jgi:hypothetical protein